MHRPNVTWVYVAVCNIHDAPPLQWLGQWGWETERRPYRDPVLHFHAPRLIALRGEDRNEETPTTENKREVLMHRACARTSARDAFAAGAQLAAPTQPALRTGLMAPVWRLLHVSRIVLIDLER